jgi:16S rRNA (guanine527-N7)-methyltransferase
MPAVAAAWFGSRLATAQRYAELLAGIGVERGLVGPREPQRLWTRHLLNSAVAAEALPAGPLRVVDVGAGAGLPGIPLALARPDLDVTLLEPMERRARFLDEVCATLNLPLTVVHCRAEDAPAGAWDVVVARAVAPLERLLALTARLVHPGGMLVALKGRTAAGEVAAAAGALARETTHAAELMAVGTAPHTATVVRVVIDRPGGRTVRRVRA